MTKRKRSDRDSGASTCQQNGIIPVEGVNNDAMNPVTTAAQLSPPVIPHLEDVIKTLATVSAEEEEEDASTMLMTTTIGCDPLVESGVSASSRTSASSTTGFTLRSHTRTQKRSHVEDGSGTSTMTAAANPLRKRVIAVAKRCVRVKASEKGKPRRSWELWSVEDKKTFFEALCEYGKDFESIRAYVVQKTRKKGSPEQVIKNKDQVRHFYYRTWHKISKYLNISDDVKKPIQELYGLINYGELRRKLRTRLDDKSGRKLNELVHEGVTMIRCKGKNLRVKTPVCRALKRLVDIEKPTEEENRKLPARIDIELLPWDNRSWARVQRVSQNPRLRLNVSLQQRLSTLIAYLQRRWIEPALKQRRELLERAGKNKHVKVDDNDPSLRLRPRRDATLRDMSIKVSTEFTSMCVSLRNYRRKVLGFLDPAPPPLPTSNCKSKSRTSSTENSKKKKIKKTIGAVTVKKSRRKLLVPRVATVKRKEEAKILCDGVADVGESTHDLTLRQLRALETAVADPISTKPADEALFARVPSFLCGASTKTPSRSSDLDKDTTANIARDLTNTSEKMDSDTVRRGWTALNCGTLTIGELYLWLGMPAKLLLNYEWDQPCLPLSSSPTSAAASQSPEDTKLTTILEQLLSIASTIVTEGGKNKPDRLLSAQSSPASCRCNHQPACPLATSSSKSNNSKSSSASGRSSAKSKSKSSTSAAQIASTVASVPAIIPSIVSTPPQPVEQTLPSTSISIEPQTPPSKQQQPQSAAEIFRVPSTYNPLQIQNRTGPALKTSSRKSLPPTRVELTQSTDDTAFKEQLFKYRKTKGRSNPVVVQRELIPKATHAHSVMKISIGPSSASQLAGSFRPVLAGKPAVAAFNSAVTDVETILSQTTTAISTAVITTSDSTRTPFTNKLSTGPDKMKAASATSMTILPNLSSFPVSKLQIKSSASEIDVCDSSSIPVMSIVESKQQRRSTNLSVSPPTISSLLDISLTETDALPLTHVNLSSNISPDKLLDRNLANNSNSFKGLIDLTLIGKSGVSVLTSNPTICGGLDHRPCTPSNSPTNSLFKFSSPGSESNWLNGDTSDYSLSNLLNHLESPIKVPASLASAGVVHSEGLDVMGRLAPDMDSQLRSFISESSIDYVAKFEDLTAQMGKK